MFAKTSAIISCWKICHIFLSNHAGKLPDIWHSPLVWVSVSCKTVYSQDISISCLPRLQLFFHVGKFLSHFLSNYAGYLPDILHRPLVLVYNVRQFWTRGMFTTLLPIFLNNMLMQATHVFRETQYKVIIVWNHLDIRQTDFHKVIPLLHRND